MRNASKITLSKFPLKQGFTIVELLIVVVVIAILAAITIVAYNGIAKKANNASIQETLSQAARKLELYRTSDPSSLYPSTLAAAGLNLVNSGGLLYVYAISTDNTQYCLASSNSGRTYYVTNTSSTPKPGICNVTTGTPGTGDVATDGASTASGTVYSIFNGATPGTSQTDFTDGGGSLKVGNRFYTTQNSGVRVVGMRIYNPASSTGTFLGLSVTAYAYLNDWTGTWVTGTTTFATTPTATKTYTTTRVAGTWTDILFDTPFTLPKISSAAGANDLLTLAVQYSGGNDYIFVTPIRAGGNSPYQSDVILGTYWSEDGFVGRAVNTLNTNSINADYGLDMLFQSLP
jgi:prepilin-type N-terminal cleavage/methylation domain-containing protein